MDVKIAARTRATGRITVQTYDAKPYDETIQPGLVEIHVTETFAGDIEGQGAVRFLQLLRPDNSASFVGLERFTGTLAGRVGTFVLQDAGVVDGGKVRGSWFVVPGSGTGDLAGLRGEGGFEADLGQGATITLDYWFE